jgi:hypothetical protein
MVPAPTTAALNTNKLSSDLSVGGNERAGR